MKTILGLDLGTNSIGWALIDVENKKILGMNSRIIPMGTDKQDYEKGVGITKNAVRREKRSARKMNKRYKLRRNKLLYILHELDMLPEQFKFKNGIPEATKIQELELLPIKKGTLQLDALCHFQLKVNALKYPLDNIKDFGKILYSYNQLRGYAGGNAEDDKSKKKEDDSDSEGEKRYEVITQKVEILNVEKLDDTFKSKNEILNKFAITVSIDNEEVEGWTKLQNLSEKIGQEEEFTIRIKRPKNKPADYEFALPQKTNWRKQMEQTEEILNNDNLFISELLLKDLEQNRWTKVRNRVILRNRYQIEFDRIWNTQAEKYPFLNNCSKDKLEKIAKYLFPGQSETQYQLRNEAIKGGLKHIIRNQIIYYQRPLKPQTDLIGNCQFEKDEKVIPTSHPLFQEFRCWDQINRMYITSKQEVYNEKKGKFVFQYMNRFLTEKEKKEIYSKLQIQKQIGFGEIAKIVNLKNDNTEFLNGLNVKAKLKGCDTLIDIRKKLGDHYTFLKEKDKDICSKIWKAVFENINNGNEYDPKSKRVSSITELLIPFIDNELAEKLALNIAQNIKYPRKYASLSKTAINNILPLMQLNPTEVSEKARNNFEQTKHLIETGEIFNQNPPEDYIISFVKKNPDALEKGGLMYAFASSLVYTRHTKEAIKPQISNYHEINYVERNLRNPVVEQLLNETMQVVKAIWKEYKLDPKNLEIRVELARDLKNSADEREKIYRAQISNQKINETIKKKLIELKQEPTQGNIDLYKLWSRQNIEDYPKQSKEPTIEEVQKLRIWEEQKCISPYTLKPIPLSKLFSPERLYDIDHIVPKSRFFDDSLSNKVVCETSINEEKDNRTAWEYISQQNSQIGICSVDNYIQHINNTFFGKKKRNLLMEKIPVDFVERQKKDTQYISVAIKDELSRVVGSDNVKTTTGEVTNYLRSHWGLKKLFMNMTEHRFKQMELWDWDYENDKPKNRWVKKYFDKEKQKNVYEIKNWSKRYDHRHHAVDALVVALTTQSHIQRLNNLNKFLQDELTKRKDEFNLKVQDGESILEVYFNMDEEKRREIQRTIEKSKHFESPFEDLVEQAKEYLQTMVVSHKPKDKLGVTIDKLDPNTPNKILKKQIKVRGSLHQETYYGKQKDNETKNLRDTKRIELADIPIKDIDKILLDKVLITEIKTHRNQPEYSSMKEAFTGEGLIAFNDKRISNGKQPVYKVKVWYNKEAKKESGLQRLYDDNEKKGVITGDNYLFIVMEKEKKNKKVRIFDIASLYDSVSIAKEAIKNQKENFRSIIAEDFRIKHKEKPDKLLFTLQQNELVYLPTDVDDPVLRLNDNEFAEWISDQGNKMSFTKRIYKVVKFTGKDCFFMPHNYASTISVPKDLSESEKDELKEIYSDKKIPKQELNYKEFGSFDTSTKTEPNENFVKELVLKKSFEGKSPLKIQDTCIKITIDWLGNTKKAAEQKNSNSLSSDILNEPEAIYQTKKMQFFDSTTQMNESDAETMAAITPEQHLKNVTELNANIFSEKLKQPMDKKLKFRD